MNTFICYLLAVALCGISTVLIRNATAYTMATNVRAEIRGKCLLMGRVLIAIAAVSAGMGAITQFGSMHH